MRKRSRAKERVFSFRAAGHRWDPRRQRPEMWNLLNGRLGAGETVRVFPLSNWTEKRRLALHRCARSSTSCRSTSPPRRPTIMRNGQLLVRRRRPPAAAARRGAADEASVRFRTLGCCPLTAAVAVDGGRPRKRRRRDARRAHVRAPGPAHRPRSGRRHGDEEARGLLLMTALTAIRRRRSARPAPRPASSTASCTC